MSAADRPQVLYRMYDQAGALLYVGITVHLGGRFDHHRRTKPWWTDVVRIEMQHFPNRAAVEEAERLAVAAEGPRYNVHLTDVPFTAAGAGSPSVRRTKQRTFTVNDDLWNDCKLIADARRDRLSSICRAGLVKFVNENRHLLKSTETDD